MGLRGPKPSRALSIPGISEKRISAPSGMSKYARRLWNEIVDSLPSSHFRPADRPLLRDFCEADATIQRMREAIEKDGDFVQGLRGGQVAHPGYAQIVAHGNLKSMLATKLRICANSRLSNDKAAREVEQPKSKRAGLMFGEV